MIIINIKMREKLGTVIPSALFNGISLIYFCVYLNTNDGECWAQNDGTNQLGLPLNPVFNPSGVTYHNVTHQMHVLLALGIVLCLFHLFNDVVVMASNKLLKFAMLSKVILFVITFIWLIAGTALRFQWSGCVCSGEFTS
jgi:hypothetical protein